MKSKQSLTAALCAGILGFSVLAGGARAAHAGPPPANFTFGVVDEDKLADGYKAYKDAVDALDKAAQNLDSQLAARQFLNDEESKKFDAIITSDNPTADDTTTLGKLVDTGNGRRAEYTGLMAKSPRSEDDNKRMKDLETTAQNNGPRVQALSDQLYDKVKKKQEETDKNFTDKANNTIGDIAGEKKLALVIRQRAIIWSSPTIDITQDVLDRLNGGKPN